MTQTNQVDLSDPRKDSVWISMFVVNIIGAMIQNKTGGLAKCSGDDVQRICSETDAEAKRFHLLDEIKLNPGGIDPEMEPGAWRTTAEWKQIHTDLTNKVLASRQRRLAEDMPWEQCDRLKEVADSLFMYQHAAPESGAGGHPNPILEDGDRGSILDELQRIMEDIKLL